MTTLTHPFTLSVARALTHKPATFTIEGASSLRLHRAGWLRSPDGRAWLTRTHGGGDIVLTPGEWRWVEPGTHWVIEPLRLRSHQAPQPCARRGAPLRIEWQPLPSRWRAWRLVWRNLLDRLRGDAAWDDARPGIRTGAHGALAASGCDARGA